MVTIPFMTRMIRRSYVIARRLQSHRLRIKYKQKVRKLTDKEKKKMVGYDRDIVILKRGVLYQRICMIGHTRKRIRLLKEYKYKDYNLDKYNKTLKKYEGEFYEQTRDK